MKNQGRIFLVIAFVTAILWSCSKNESVKGPVSLKQSVNNSAMDLNSAMNAIVSTKAYSILTVNDLTAKSASDSTFRVNITLDTIKGIYNYKPVVKHDRWGMPLIDFFTRTADANEMIVNLPLEKVTKPRFLHLFSGSDTTMTNNFSIAVSDYHNDYNSFHDFDYLLKSSISVDSVVTGDLNISSLRSPTLGTHYASQFAFTGSYTANYKYDSGDTIVSSFSIMNGTNILYEEKLLTIKNDTLRFGREHQYILAIGNVQITRTSGSKSVQISVDGVVQPGAKVEIIDKEADSEASVCKKRDVQITFEDGTVTSVSALIGNSVTNINTLYTSLHQVFFAAYIVDWIAYDIYYNR